MLQVTTFHGILAVGLHTCDTETYTYYSKETGAHLRGLRDHLVRCLWRVDRPMNVVPTAVSLLFFFLEGWRLARLGAAGDSFDGTGHGEEMPLWLWVSLTILPPKLWVMNKGGIGKLGGGGWDSWHGRGTRVCTRADGKEECSAAAGTMAPGLLIFMRSWERDWWKIARGGSFLESYLYQIHWPFSPFFFFKNYYYYYFPLYN